MCREEQGGAVRCREEQGGEVHEVYCGAGCFSKMGRILNSDNSKMKLKQSLENKHGALLHCNTVLFFILAHLVFEVFLCDLEQMSVHCTFFYNIFYWVLSYSALQY